MKLARNGISYLCIICLITSPILFNDNGKTYADDKKYNRDSEHRKESKKDTSKRSKKHITKNKKSHERDRKHYKKHHSSPSVIHRGSVYSYPNKRVRHYRNIKIIRPYGHWYYGYGHIHHDHDAYLWLGFTAITLILLNNLNEQQQRQHESAQIQAATAPIGEKIIWKDGSTSGSVTAIREGTSTTGRHCREFQQNVTIGGKKEQAYGTACRQPDGSWEVISTESQ